MLKLSNKNVEVRFTNKNGIQSYKNPHVDQFPFEQLCLYQELIRTLHIKIQSRPNTTTQILPLLPAALLQAEVASQARTHCILSLSMVGVAGRVQRSCLRISLHSSVVVLTDHPKQNRTRVSIKCTTIPPYQDLTPRGVNFVTTDNQF